MSEQDLEGRVALVTGGSRGIGAAICVELAKHGAIVAVNYNSSEAAALAVVEKITASGGKAMAFKADISDLEQVEALIKAVTDTFGGLDILVNNAGTTLNQLLMRTKDADMERIIEVNLLGPMRVTKAAMRPLLRSKHGRIIFNSSVVGVMGNPGQSAYAAAKAGIIGFAKSVAKEVGSRGITSNCVAPGFVETEILEGMEPGHIALAASHIQIVRDVVEAVPANPGDTTASEDTMTKEEREKAAFAAAIAAARPKLGQPEDVASYIAFLATDGASYITGQCLNLDGGMVMA